MRDNAYSGRERKWFPIVTSQILNRNGNKKPVGGPANGMFIQPVLVGAGVAVAHLAPGRKPCAATGIDINPVRGALRVHGSFCRGFANGCAEALAGNPQVGDKEGVWHVAGAPVILMLRQHSQEHGAGGCAGGVLPDAAHVLE